MVMPGWPIDTRGAGASFGSQPWEFSPLNVSDSQEVMDWIVAQPWSNGKIGTIGHSYSGNLAEFALLNKHPAVKAASVLSSSFDLYTDILRPGGIPLQPFIHNWENFTKEFDANIVPRNLGKYKPFMQKIAPVDDDKQKTELKAALEEHKHNSDLDVLDKINFRDDQIFHIASADGKEHTPLIDRCLKMLEDRFLPRWSVEGIGGGEPAWVLAGDRQGRGADVFWFGLVRGHQCQWRDQTLYELHRWR